MANLETITEELSKLTLMEAAELVTTLEDKWGVKAAAGGGMMAAAAPAAEAAAEQTEFDVILEACGDKKIQVIKAVREITGLGLKEAKAMVDGAPGTVKAALPKADAEAMVAKLTEQGAKAVMK